MSHELKRRLIGATVLISLAIIFLPMILEHEPLMVDRGKMTPIPGAPSEKFDSSLIRDEVPVESSLSAQVESETITNQAEPAPAASSEVAPGTRVGVVDTAQSAKPEAILPETEPASPPDPEPVAESSPDAAQPKQLPSAWVIQVGSFSNEGNARKLVARLRKGGLDTMDPLPAVVNGKQLYRVKVGPELDKQNMQELLPRVKKIAGLQGTVIRYP